MDKPENSSNRPLTLFSPAGGEHLPFYKQFIAGGAAGLVEVLTMYPLDVVKTRFQLQKGSGKYTSVVSTFSTIVREEGFGRLYRGIISPVLAEAPKRAVKFACNEQYKRLFIDSKGHLSYSGASAAGALAGATEAFVNCPFEVVKVRMQSTDSKGLYKNTFDAMTKIANTEGLVVFYRGLEAQLTRNAIWNGTYFGIIPIVKANLWKPKNKKDEQLRNFIAGFVGGSIATTFNTPFDVVKSRFQNSKGAKAAIPWSVAELAIVAREEGVRALWKGYVPRILRLGPGGGIMLLAFDFFSTLL